MDRSIDRLAPTRPGLPSRQTPTVAKGVADPNAAGLFTALVRRAGALAPADADEPAQPTVLIETEKQCVCLDGLEWMDVLDDGGGWICACVPRWLRPSVD